MTCNKEKEVLLCMIDMYKDMPYLWQKEHKEYMNKNMRAEAFKVLLGIYKNFDENATVKTLKKKIENMRTSYTKELKKVLASKRTGAGADEVYVPSLWYFDALSFLGSRTESCRTVTDSLENEIQIQNSSSEDETASVTNSSSGSRKKKKKDTLLQRQENILLSAERVMAEKDEEWEVYGRSIGFHVKDLNKRQMIIAQKIISDVLFYAKLDQLTESSYVVLSPFNDTSSSFMPNDRGFYQRQNQFPSPSPPSNYSSPSPSSQPQSPHHSFSHFTPWPLFHTQSVRQPLPEQQTQLPNSPSPHQSSNAQIHVHHTQTVRQPLPSPQQQTQLPNSPSPHQSSNAQIHVHHTQTVRQPLPSPQQQTQLPNSPSPHQSSNAQIHVHHTQTVRQPLPSPQQQTQLPNSPSPHQSSNAQIHVHHTQTVRQPLPSPQQQTQLPNSPSPHQSSNAQIHVHHTQTVRQPLKSLQNQMLQSLSQRPSPNAEVKAQPSPRSQELPFDDVITVDNSEQFLEYLPDENTSDGNSGSLPIIEGPAELMKEFLIVKRKK